MAKRFKWTRERFYRAKHLCRLLMYITGSPPPIVNEYIKLMDSLPWKDPLTDPVWVRKERHFGDPEIPF